MSAMFHAAAFVLLGSALAGQPQTLPIVKASYLRDAGVWLVLEGELSIVDREVAIEVPPMANLTTLSVETLDPTPKALSTTFVKQQNGSFFKLTFPDGTEKARVRMSGISNAAHWIPRYRLSLAGKESKLTLWANVHSTGRLPMASEREALVAAGSRKEAWSDAGFFALPKGPTEVGNQLFVLIDEKVTAEEIVSIELGGMEGERPPRPTRDTVETKISLLNPTPKSLPGGSMIIAENNRLRASIDCPTLEPGATVEIPLGPAVGITVTKEERELSRKPVAVRSETAAPDLVETVGSVVVTNRRGQAVNVRILKEVHGDVSAANEGAKVYAKPNKLGVLRSITEIQWNLTIPAGESKRLTFGTKTELTPSNVKDADL